MTPLLVRVDDLNKQTSAQYAFARSPVRIGRNSLNDLALEFPFVSQWHAVVQFDENDTQFFDLGSTNGTAVNGARVGKNVPVPVTPATEFRIGALRIFFARGPAPAELLNARPGGGFGAQGAGTETSERTMFATTGGFGGGEATLMFDPESAGPGRPPPAAGGNAMANLAQMRQIVTQLRPAYDGYRRAWTTLNQQITDALRNMPAPNVKLALAFVEREFPALANEEQFRAVAMGQQVGLSGPSGTAFAAGTLVSQMSQYFVPTNSAPETSVDVERMLVRVAAVLDAFSTSFVALRKGYDQFGSEMGLPQHKSMDGSPIDSGVDPRHVLAYLLDWTADGNARIQELARTFADIMMHQVALLNGVTEGVRSLLNRLGPTEIDREIQVAPGGVGKIFRALWPFRDSARWRRYTQQHRSLTEEDEAIMKAIFDRKFVEAYNRLFGKNFTEAGPPGLNDSNRR